MKAQLALLSKYRSPALGALVLVIGLLVGFTLASRSAPPPRPAALLWDDYILAVATLYQRDGDLAAARERLAKLATDNPVGSVEALAAVYIPDSQLGENSAGALRNLAVALTGRSIPVAASSPAAPPSAIAAADPSGGLGAVFRSQLFWSLIFVVCVGVLALTYIRRRPAQLALASGAASTAADVSAPPKTVAVSRGVERKARTTWQSVRPIAAAEPRRPERRLPGDLVVPAARFSVSFTYQGGADSLEAMQPILDPLTGRPIAGCGMTNGPRADGEGEGYLGFLVWLHELGSREVPQTVGLLATGAGEHCHEAVSEWADYARVDELVVARPGVVRTFETRRLRAAVSVVDVEQTRVVRQRYRVLSHLVVKLDITFKEASVRVPELVH